MSARRWPPRTAPWWATLLLTGATSGFTAAAEAPTTPLRVELRAPAACERPSGQTWTVGRRLFAVDGASDGWVASSHPAVRCGVERGMATAQLHARCDRWPTLPLRATCEVAGREVQVFVHGDGLPQQDATLTDGRVRLLKPRGAEAMRTQVPIDRPEDDDEALEPASVRARGLRDTRCEVEEGGRVLWVEAGARLSRSGEGICRLPKVGGGRLRVTVEVAVR